MLAALVVLLILGVPLESSQAVSVLGLFFSGTEFSDVTTNLDTVGAPFNSYIVTLNPGVTSIAGYEVGITISDPTVFVLKVFGPNDWSNDGDQLNQLVDFGTPLPVIDNAAVLGTMSLLYIGQQYVEFHFGPASPPGLPDHQGPLLSDGDNPDNLIPCGTYGGHEQGLVATLNSYGPPVEATTLSQLKSMFR